MSTPIETNTEALREILDEVYNLPNRSTGGSSEPDLVIEFNDPNGEGMNDHPEKFSYDANAVIRVMEKLRGKKPVSCVLRSYRDPWLDSEASYPSDMFSPFICANVYFDEPEYGNYAWLELVFSLPYGRNDVFYPSVPVTIYFDVHDYGTNNPSVESWAECAFEAQGDGETET